ncbi:hypothetical protein [Sporomusa sp. KB1]|jgi:hypothetical protein|nr:hypothetical protein [Sporomusa sp. KB1]TWH49547.1 hypothetical protein Salpa_5779 [Sporomusa sp. KB1]
MRRFFLAAGNPVGVDIDKHLRGTVAQTVLGVFDADALADRRLAWSCRSL